MNWEFLIPLLVLLVSCIPTSGQEIGTEICSCTPKTYEFTLDFSLTCPPVNITLGDAVEATSCLVSPFGSPNVVDLVPVLVDGIDVLELGQNLRVVAQTDINYELFDGDTFTYTSAVANPDSIGTVQEVPRALQLNIVGLNAEGERIINVFIATFTNDCGSYPVFQEGQSAGWVRFTGIGSGSPEMCSAVTPVPTPTPTDSPIVPTDVPVATNSPISPTSSPVVPVEIQSSSPTEAKVTMTPSLSVTNIPTSEPTPATDAPVVDPTLAPTETGDNVADSPTTDSMSMSMEMSMPGRLLDEFWEESTKDIEFGERRLRRNNEQRLRRLRQIEN